LPPLSNELPFRNERSAELDGKLEALKEALHGPARRALASVAEDKRAGRDVDEQALFLPLLKDTIALWDQVETAYGDYGRRLLGKIDRYYLLTVLLHRADAVHPWLFARCREVEQDPDGYLDLWAREHYKSTIITFAGSIQEILNDPNITIGIFSHVKPIARKFMAQIKGELERNTTLHWLYPDVLYSDPKNESVRWSEEKGIVVKRSQNSKEATVEGHGLVDGQPTSAHFKLRIYDDVVTLESVSTPDQVEKTTKAWELSDNLGAADEEGDPGRSWHIGTRYHFKDSYAVMLERKALKPRIYPATSNGTLEGRLVFLTPKAWKDKLGKQSTPTVAAQLLQNPTAGGNRMFKDAGLRFSDIRPATLNVYILCDPASSKKKGSDRTAMPVVGVDAQFNLWLLDGYCHKMSLAERWTYLYQLRKHWLSVPGVQVLEVGYERYGMRSDLEYFEEKMEDTKDVFEIKELNWPSEGPNAKPDRIQRLEPFHRENAGRLYLPALYAQETKDQKKMRTTGEPHRIFKPVIRMDHEGRRYSLNAMYLAEYQTYPYSAHDDFLDAVSRIFDMEPRKPEIIDQRATEPPVFADGA
jgi:hypothetical protein